VTLDLATLFFVTVVILGLGGVLLLFAWLQNRSTTALAWWGGAFLLFAPATALFGLRGHISEFWSIVVCNMVYSLAYGLLWTGARVFEGRRPALFGMAAGAAVWLLASQFSFFMQSLPLRIVLASTIVLTYCLLFVRELWQGRNEGLMSRWPVMAMVGLHGLFFLVRVPAVTSLPFPVGANSPDTLAALAMVFGPLFYAFALVFLLMALTKERAELYQRRAANIDPLTGIANRRGFTELAARVIVRSNTDKAPLALLLFDLDNFKGINDRFGHRAGDRVLVLFANTVQQALRPLDLVGRIGGEEFVALLPGVTPDTMMDIAERVRDSFADAAREVDGQRISATVSIGTASATQAGYDFDILYAVADAALYRAKQKGRNRIEAGRPSLTMLPQALES
jgi:diguanylate cyclase (GGDEF)-like protein